MHRGFGESVDALSCPLIAGSCTDVYIKRNLQMCKLCVCRIVTAARATRTEQATKANPTAEAATATRTEAAKSETDGGDGDGKRA